jgi:c-di-GMP phosphodiesterase
MQAYHFFNPLLTADQAWAAFEWQASPPLRSDLATVATAVDTCLPLAKLHPLWFPCAPEWLDDADWRSLRRKFACDQVVFAFPAETAENGQYDATCRQLRLEGAHVALEVVDSGILKKVSVASFSHLAFDAEHARASVPLIDLINANQCGYQLVATGVGSHELFDWALAKRFSLVSGRFIASLDPRNPSDADTTRLKLLKLLSLVVQDADTREIEEIFRQEPKLSYNLLRLVNSVAVGPKTPITGFNQAITVLGRRQLQRWLQLLIYANQFGQAGQPNPLLQLAAARGRLLELLVDDLPPIPDIGDSGEAAFMTGIFSLLDTLLRLPMADVLAALPLAPTVTAALAERSGVLGQLLAATIAGNDGRYEAAVDILTGLGIDPGKHLTAQVSAYAWASRITLE